MMTKSKTDRKEDDMMNDIALRMALENNKSLANDLMKAIDILNYMKFMITFIGILICIMLIKLIWWM